MSDFGYIKLGRRGVEAPIVKARRHRGRPVGVKNAKAPGALAMDIPGAASSAAKMNRLTGVQEMASQWIWVPNEGWVKWADLARQVTRAFADWRHRKAMQGVKIFDGNESRAAAYAEAKAQKMKLAA